MEVVFFFFFFWSGSPAWGSLGGVGAGGTHRWVRRAVPNVGPGGGSLLQASWGAGWGAGGAQSIRRGSSSCSAPGRGTRPLARLGATMGSGSGPCPHPAPPRGRLPHTLQKEQPGCDPPGGLHGCWAAPELLAEEGTLRFAWIRGPSSCAFAPGAGGCRMTTPEQIWGGVVALFTECFSLPDNQITANSQSRTKSKDPPGSRGGAVPAQPGTNQLPGLLTRHRELCGVLLRPPCPPGNPSSRNTPPGTRLSRGAGLWARHRPHPALRNVTPEVGMG